MTDHFEDLLKSTYALAFKKIYKRLPTRDEFEIFVNGHDFGWSEHHRLHVLHCYGINLSDDEVT